MDTENNTNKSSRTKKTTLGTALLLLIIVCIFCVFLFIDAHHGLNGLKEDNRNPRYEEAIVSWMEKRYKEQFTIEHLDYQSVDSIYTETFDNTEEPVLEKIVIKHEMKIDGKEITLYFIYNEINNTVENVRFIYNDRTDLINNFQDLKNEVN